MEWNNPIHFLFHLLAQPWWLQLWIGWMIGLNTASLFFLEERAGRLTLIAWLVNLVIMPLIFVLNGYNRLLGLSHVLCWTPLLFLLLKEWPKTTLNRRFGVWLRLLVITNSISLIVDYIDVARYFSGDR